MSAVPHPTPPSPQGCHGFLALSRTSRRLPEVCATIRDTLLWDWHCLSRGTWHPWRGAVLCPSQDCSCPLLSEARWRGLHLAEYLDPLAPRLQAFCSAGCDFRLRQCRWPVSKPRWQGLELCPGAHAQSASQRSGD